MNTPRTVNASLRGFKNNTFEGGMRAHAAPLGFLERLAAAEPGGEYEPADPRDPPRLPTPLMVRHQPSLFFELAPVQGESKQEFPNYGGKY